MPSAYSPIKTAWVVLTMATPDGCVMGKQSRVNKMEKRNEDCKKYIERIETYALLAEDTAVVGLERHKLGPGKMNARCPNIVRIRESIYNGLLLLGRELDIKGIIISR
jgi:hypothetical protein